MDQLGAMRAFCRVVETGGFRRAADALGMPKATVSKMIGDLEGHLRVRLLNRTTRSVQPTDEGALYYEHASIMLQQLDDLDGAFDREGIRPTGRLSVDASAWVMSAVLIPALPRFHAAYPDVRLILSVSDRPVQLVKEGVDCAIRGGELPDQSMVARLLGRTDWMTVASPDYLERHGVPGRPADLSIGHVLVHQHLPKAGRPNPFRFERAGSLVEVVAGSFLSVNESNAHLAAGEAGLGVLQGFEWKFREAVAEGRLVPILAEWGRPAYPFHVLYPSKRFMSARLRVFIDWLTDVFAEFERP